MVLLPSRKKHIVFIVFSIRELAVSLHRVVRLDVHPLGLVNEPHSNVIKNVTITDVKRQVHQRVLLELLLYLLH